MTVEAQQLVFAVLDDEFPAPDTRHQLVDRMLWATSEIELLQQILRRMKDIDAPVGSLWYLTQRLKAARARLGQAEVEFAAQFDE